LHLSHHHATANCYQPQGHRKATLHPFVPVCRLANLEGDGIPRRTPAAYQPLKALLIPEDSSGGASGASASAPVAVQQLLSWAKAAATGAAEEPPRAGAGSRGSVDGGRGGAEGSGGSGGGSCSATAVAEAERRARVLERLERLEKAFDTTAEAYRSLQVEHADLQRQYDKLRQRATRGSSGGREAAA
jgi:hypothetical protein